MCGQCKKRAEEQMEKLLVDLQEKSKNICGKNG